MTRNSIPEASEAAQEPESKAAHPISPTDTDLQTHEVISIPVVRELQHRYERVAACRTPRRRVGREKRQPTRSLDLEVGPHHHVDGFIRMDMGGTSGNGPGE